MEIAEWQDAVQCIKNNATSRQINRLFKVSNDEDYVLPTFYFSLEDIPFSMPGIYFFWLGTCLEYVAVSVVCVYSSIKRSEVYRPDKHIISAAANGDWYECNVLKRFMVASFRPAQNPLYVCPAKPGRPKTLPDDTDARFWAKVELPHKGQWDGGCRRWLGNTNSKGYGRVRIWGKLRLAHRVAYRLAEGEIPVGGRVVRKCGDKLCCNPIHFELRLPKGQKPRRDLILEEEEALRCRVLTGTSNPEEQQRILKELKWWED